MQRPFDKEAFQRLSRRIDQASDFMARVSGTDIPAADFYQLLTTKTISVIGGTAGIVWMKSPQGQLQRLHQTNLATVGLDNMSNGRTLHSELLRHALSGKQSYCLEPSHRLPTAVGTECGNPSTYPLLLSPILDDQGQTLGLFEVFLDADADVKMRHVAINFVNHMSGFATNYLRNNTALRNTVQEQVFTLIESFSRQIHASLNPTEVAYLIVNEGRRVIGCDRLSAGIRHGKHTRIEAVSGADAVERSSVQIKSMRDLFDAVLDWNDRLVYSGTPDQSLPPKVANALNTYLTQSNPKLLVVQPLRDEREKVKSRDKDAHYGPARSALLLESFDSPDRVEPLLDRFNLVAGHAASALYNAAEMKRIPFAFIWKPIMALQGRAGGKRRFYTMIGLGIATALVLAMIFVTYPLKLDAKGQLEPEEWNYIYPADSGRIVQFKVGPGQIIRPNTPIAVLSDQELGRQINEKLSEIVKGEAAVKLLGSQAASGDLPPGKRKEKADELEREQNNLNSLNDQLNLMLEQHRADRANPGQFLITAPEFPRSRSSRGLAEWKVLNADFVHQMVNRWVRPSDPLLRVGNTTGAWQIEMKVPQKHIGQLLRAYKSGQGGEYLEVDVLVTSAPTQTFKGRLYRRDISAEAVQNKDDHNESELVVHAYVRVNDPDMPAPDHIPKELLTTGVEVHTKIRCGNHSLGYSLFHGGWEFFYENVLFWF